MNVSVLHLSTFDTGGAGQAAYRFHRNLLKSGFRSYFCVRTRHTDAADVIATSKHNYRFRIKDFLTRSLFDLKNGVPDADYFFYDKGNVYPPSIRGLSEVVGKDQIKAIVLHDISAFLHLADVVDIQRQFGGRVFWYQMDVAPLTGGCHFSWGCERFLDRCGFCPALKSDKLNDFSRLQWKRKSVAVDNLNMVVLAPTNEVKRLVKRSPMFASTPVELLMLGVDETIFNSNDRLEARQRLGLPFDRPIIFFGADVLSNRRKGFGFLLQALEILKTKRNMKARQPVLLLAGRGGISTRQFSSFETRYLGHLENDEQLSRAYKASDVFISPSIQDFGPYMVNQSLMCGTPVISFPTGVARDLVVTGKTGFLTEQASSQSLAIGLEWFLSLSAEKLSEIQRNSAKSVSDRVSSISQVERFQSILRQFDISMI